MSSQTWPTEVVAHPSAAATQRHHLDGILLLLLLLPPPSPFVPSCAFGFGLPSAVAAPETTEEELAGRFFRRVAATDAQYRAAEYVWEPFRVILVPVDVTKQLAVSGYEQG